MESYFFESRRRHTRCALVTGVQTFALPICTARVDWVVESRASGDDGRWTVRLRATDRHGLVQRGQAQGDELLDAARIAGDRLLAALGGDAIVAGDEPAPDLEERLQRARSAMLANELDTARRILNEAPELQRSRPQLRYRLARSEEHTSELQSLMRNS